MRKLFLIFLLCAWACHSSKHTRIEFSVDVIKECEPITLSFYDFVEDWYGVELENTASSMLGEIVKIEFDSVFIFVEAEAAGENTIFVFDRAGKFHNQIGSKGRAPNEYLNIAAWTVNQKKQEIWLLDNFLLQIKRFSYSGEYLGSRKVDERFRFGRDLLYCPNGNFVLQNVVMEGCALEFRILNSELKEIGCFGQRNMRVKGAVNPIGSGVYLNDTCVYIIPTFNDTIYECKDSVFIPCYYIEAAQTVPAYFDYEGQDYRAVRDQFISQGYVFGRTCLFVDEYIFIQFPNKDILWNVKKQSGYALAGEKRNGDDMIVCPNLIATDNISDYVVGYCPAMYLLNQKKDFQNFSGVSDRVKTIYNGIKEDSNPVLFFYKLRKDIKKKS